jgi:hypothetical protein
VRQQLPSAPATPKCNGRHCPCTTAGLLSAASKHQQRPKAQRADESRGEHNTPTRAAYRENCIGPMHAPNVCNGFIRPRRDPKMTARARNPRMKTLPDTKGSIQLKIRYIHNSEQCHARIPAWIAPITSAATYGTAHARPAAGSAWPALCSQQAMRVGSLANMRPHVEGPFLSAQATLQATLPLQAAA